jgi:hypothetical protein
LGGEVAPCGLVGAKVSEKHAVSIFRAEVAMLGSWIYIGLGEVKAEKVNQSETCSASPPLCVLTSYKPTCIWLGNFGGKDNLRDLEIDGIAILKKFCVEFASVGWISMS